MAIKLLAIGSCRLYGPLRAASESEGFEYKPIFGHTHNPQEIAQALKILSGDLEVSQEHASLMNILSIDRVKKNVDTFKRELAESDVIAVEVSSLRSIYYSGLSYQKNTIADALRTSGVSEGLIKEVGRGGNVPEPVRDAVCAGLEHSALKEIVKFGDFSELDFERTKLYLDELVGLVDMPVLLVGVVHVFPETPSTSVRGRLQSYLQRFSDSTRNVAFMNPSTLVTLDNYDAFMKDAAHYRPEAMSTVGRTIYSEARALIA